MIFKLEEKIIIMKLSFIFIVLLTFFMNGCGLLSKKYVKSDKEVHRVSAVGKKTLLIENINGNISFVSSSDSGIVKIVAEKEIKVKKKYLNTPFDEITIEIDSTGNEIKIESIINNKGRDDGFNFNFDRKQKVDYEISVPEGISISVENVNGKISADNISNDLKIDQVNGSVDLDNYSGLLECDLTNGSFSGVIDSTKGININVINGSVTLNLSNYISARVNAQSENGKISTDNLKFSDMIQEKKSFKGNLGTEDNRSEIIIKTVNGKIVFTGNKEI